MSSEEVASHLPMLLLFVGIATASCIVSVSMEGVSLLYFMTYCELDGEMKDGRVIIRSQEMKELFISCIIHRATRCNH